MNNKIISCATHDYIEIACTFGYLINLHLCSGSTLSGKAVTTLTTKEKKEFLVIEKQNKQLQVELIDIKSMQAVDLNPHFETVRF